MDRDDFFAMARADLTGPLDGLRVLEADTTWSAPMAGCVLGDLGAEVIKAELPTGDVTRIAPPHLPGTNLSFAHQTINRNKRSVSLDPHEKAGQDVFRRLAAESDVIIENFLPGTMESWGLDYSAIREVRPNIVYLSITGFGLPVKAPTFLSDDLAGLHGVIAILAAVRHRDQTGEGQHIDVAMLDATVYQSNGNLTLGAMGASPERLGSELPVAVPCNTYRCRDGAVFIALILDSHWTALVGVMKRDDLAADETLAGNAGRSQNATS